MADPLHASPHYWSAAEMILLQLDTLACNDVTTDAPPVIVGAGLPAEWLQHPLAVKGLFLRNGLLDWTWNGERVSVTLDVPIAVTLGSVFPPNTPVEIRIRHR